jgi:arsenite transporter
VKCEILPVTPADMSEKLDTVKVDTVSLPIALGLWLMMWPVLTKVGASEPAHERT